jgi:beta-galactosidase/beta-glucuronidase
MFERSAWINLNGKWNYALTSAGTIPVEYDGTIVVPFCVESPLSGVERDLSPDMRIWYRRTFARPEMAEHQHLLLHFEAVDHVADVFVNGIAIGSHTGGYLPFSFDITSYLTSTENEIVVAVADPTDAGFQERGKQVLAPKGIWYTATSGIWQTV